MLKPGHAGLGYLYLWLRRLEDGLAACRTRGSKTLTHIFTFKMDDPSSGSNTHLTWSSIAFAFSFIAFDAIISFVFGLKIGTSLVTSAVRCVVQLGLMALVLRSVFEAQTPWAVAGIACMSLDIIQNEMQELTRSA